MRPIEEPMTRDDESPSSRDGTITTHPAFGQIVAHRVSGYAALYASDFRHQHYITVTISGSELHRDLSRDWHYAKKQKIEVAMTEAQWATFVSSFGMGGGVPCTVQWDETGVVPGLPEPKERSDQFQGEMKRMMADARDQVRRAIAEVESLGVSKKKAAAVTERLEKALQHMESNAGFVAKQFGEHVEGTVEKAKAEIHGYMTNVVHRAGLDALTSEDMPLMIEHKEE